MGPKKHCYATVAPCSLHKLKIHSSLILHYCPLNATSQGPLHSISSTREALSKGKLSKKWRAIIIHMHTSLACEDAAPRISLQM